MGPGFQGFWTCALKESNIFLVIGSTFFSLFGPMKQKNALVRLHAIHSFADRLVSHLSI